MKKNTIIAAIAAATAILLCASCQKQELIGQNNGINAEGKIFTATIEQSLTKTTITDEYKVNWVTGDIVSINGEKYTATVDASNPTKATLAPTGTAAAQLSGKYCALYPDSLAVPKKDAQNPAYFAFPATQTYTAGQFNAPMYAESTTEAFTFNNICGVLCLSLKGTDKVKSISVTANEAICGKFEMTDATTVNLTGNGKTVTLDCGEGVQLSSTDSTNFYIYLPPKDSYTAGMKIVATSTEGKTFEKTTKTAVKIEKNNIYTFDWTATFSGSAPEPEYVEITMTVGGVAKTYKWAKCNLGAETVNDYGDYYAWGEIETKSDYSPDTYSTDAKNISTNIAPDSGKDVARSKLGGNWRMPTKEEFIALDKACGGTGAMGQQMKEMDDYYTQGGKVKKGKYWLKANQTILQGINELKDIKAAGLLYSDGENYLFFPAAGYSPDISRDNVGTHGYYWSSTFFDSDNASDFHFGKTAILNTVTQENHGFRYHGHSVRPISD